MNYKNISLIQTLVPELLEAAAAFSLTNSSSTPTSASASASPSNSNFSQFCYSSFAVRRCTFYTISPFAIRRSLFKNPIRRLTSFF
jgi:hypothetical protein